MRRRREWEVITHDHFFRLFGLPSLNSCLNSGKKVIQNTLLSMSIPRAFEMQARHLWDGKVLKLNEHVLEIGGGQQVFEIPRQARKAKNFG